MLPLVRCAVAAFLVPALACADVAPADGTPGEGEGEEFVADSIEVRRQALLDAQEGVTITDFLIVGPSDAEDPIDDLSPLDDLASIRQAPGVLIDLVDIERFEALPALRCVGPRQGPGAGIHLRFNTSLTTVTMPPNLTALYHLTIAGNPALTHVDLGNLSRLGSLVIDDNFALTSIVAEHVELICVLRVADGALPVDQVALLESKVPVGAARDAACGAELAAGGSVENLAFVSEGCP